MKIYIENYGCSANYNNGEILAGILKKAGHKLTSEKSADLVILNTCTVKQPTESKIFKRIKELPKSKKLIVSGCMPEVQAEEIRKIRKDVSLLGINDVGKVLDIVERLCAGKNSSFISQKKEIKLSLPKIRRNPAINIVQISEGCNQDCSYCIVRIAKGSLVSYPSEKIIEDITSSIKEGCKEIWITSQDNAAYGFGLIELLKKIISIDGEFMIRIGMMNPQHITPIKKELIKIYKHKKVFKFLHIPVQSGNDRVLKAMNRKYSVSDFKKIITDFRKEIPNIAISTDMICGFPTETNKEFEDSLALVKEIKPDVLNVSRFGARKGTAAAKMKQLHGRETKTRSQEMTRLFHKLVETKLKKNIGKKYKILVDEQGKKKGQFIGRTMNYIPVVVETVVMANDKKSKSKAEFKLGDFVSVKITNSRTHHLVGEVLK